MRKAVIVLFLAVLAAPAAPALAQQGWQARSTPEPVPSRHATSPARPKASAQPPRPKPPAAAGSPAGAQPLQAQADYLVRTTLLTLNDANQTGNYSVLRDLAAPPFRERNSAADLAQVFAELRRTRLDLSIAAVLAPIIEETPTIDAERRLRLKGSYHTVPNRIVFDIVFDQVAGRWQLFGLSIATRPSQSAAGGPVVRN